SKYTFFIEEPEAHLFPVSQKNIVSLIGNIYNYKPHNFVITTHSPYILTAFNNLIFGYEVSKKNDIEKIKKIIDPDSLINYEDVSAYTINNGVLESIKDDETKLIGASIIDSVSDDLSETFDSLIELDMSD
ncbi:MAG: AAA family ATPase, partial [Deltaproteobacteria bacterium]|nr:AAA family ATPase [Deltaproteobacteria bacterium]